MSYFRHESAIVDDGADDRRGHAGLAFRPCLRRRAHRRAASSLGQNVFVGNHVVIGDDCKIQNNVSVYDDVTLEDDVFCGPSMVFTNVVQSARRDRAQGRVSRRRWSRRGATLGANCTIVCGVTIGEYAFVARRRGGHPRRPGLRAGRRRAGPRRSAG